MRETIVPAQPLHWGCFHCHRATCPEVWRESVAPSAQPGFCCPPAQAELWVTRHHCLPLLGLRHGPGPAAGAVRSKSRARCGGGRNTCCGLLLCFVLFFCFCMRGSVLPNKGYLMRDSGSLEAGRAFIEESSSLVYTGETTQRGAGPGPRPHRGTVAGRGWQCGERSVTTEGARQTVATRGCFSFAPSHSKW